MQRVNHGVTQLRFRCQLNSVTKSKTIRRCTFSLQTVQPQGWFSRAWKTFRESPNTKYWILGLSVASSGTYYFVEKDRKNKQILATVLPPTPSHYCHPREQDVEQLLEMHKKLKKKNDLVKIHITGMAGMGKTQLSRLFVEKLSQQQKDQFHFLSGNEIIGTLKGDTVDSYLLSLKGLLLALKCTNSEWTSKLSPGQKIQHQDIDTQVRILTEVLCDKLSQSPGWIVIVDNVYSLESWLKKCLPGEERDWGKGTLVISSQVSPQTSSSVDSEYVHSMKSMGSTEAVELLQKVSGLPEDSTEGILETAAKLQSIPLGLVAAGTYVNIKLQSTSSTNFKEFLQDFEIASEKFKSVNQTETSAKPFKELAPVIVSTAMATKVLVESDPHLLHGFDFLASCPEQNPVPISLLCYHLKRPEFRLPIAQRTANDLMSLLPIKSDIPSGDSVIPLEEVKTQIWSFKGMVEKILETKQQIMDGYNDVKRALGYGEPFTLPELDDGMGMVRNCNLLTVIKEKPGDVECVHVHPVVHLVLQQLHLSLTAPMMEEQFLQQAEDMYNHSSVFRRLWAFDPQTKLQEYRNNLGEKVQTKLSDNPVTQHGNLTQFTGYDVQGILQNDMLKCKKEYRKLNTEHLFKHLQEHWSRVVGSITAECISGSADVKSQAAQKFIVPIATCILASHLPEELGSNTTSQALIGLASVYSNVYENAEASKDLLGHALQIQEPRHGKESMEVAEIYTHLAITHNSLDNIQYSKELLEKAMEIYETHRKKHGEYKQPSAYARTLGALGVVVGTLGDKQRSKDLLEKAITVFQSAQPSGKDEAENRKFAMDIASNLTDLGHAYLCLGQLFQGWKVLELSLQGHKNLHGDKHPEVVRTLTVLSIAKLMQGNDTESRRLRQEAGKIEKSLAAAPML